MKYRIITTVEIDVDMNQFKDKSCEDVIELLKDEVNGLAYEWCEDCTNKKINTIVDVLEKEDFEEEE